MRVGVVDPNYDDPVFCMTLGSPDNGVIIRYDARQSSPKTRCIFGQWEIIGYSVDGGAGYYPQGECIYYEWDDRFEDRTVYVFTVAQFEDGLPNGSCEKNVIRFSGTELSAITTTSGETTKGLWNGVVTTRDQRFWPEINVDETGESELVDGIPTLLGYTGTGSVKFSRVYLKTALRCAKCRKRRRSRRPLQRQGASHRACHSVSQHGEIP